MHNETPAISGTGDVPLPLEDIHIVSYQSTPIRAAMIDGQPWFVAVDVCRALGSLNPRHGAAKHVWALAAHDKMIARLPRNPRGTPAVLIVSADGLDKLLWLELHNVRKAWFVLSSLTAQASTLPREEAA